MPPSSARLVPCAAKAAAQPDGHRPASRRLPTRWLTALPIAAALFACAPLDGAPREQAAADQAVVSSQTFDRAHEIVRSIDYLPFEFYADGCFARAYYMSMELAAERIESNAVFAIRKRGFFGNFTGPAPSYGGISWTYHVAPLIEVETPSGAPRPMVVDPALSKHPFSLDAWLDAIQVKADQVDLMLMKGAELDGNRAIYLARERGSTTEQLTESFEDMPPFEIADVQEACQWMHAFLYLEAHRVDAQGELLPGHEPVSDADAVARAAPKRARLLARTAQLVEALSAVGKLQGTATFSAEECAAIEDRPLHP